MKSDAKETINAAYLQRSVPLSEVNKGKNKQ